MEVKVIKPFKEAETVAQIAIVYQQAFGNAPWNEGYKCPICETVVPLSFFDLVCPECLEKTNSIAMIEYWPISKVISDFYLEMAKPKSFCLTIEDEKVLGFVWGYKLKPTLKTALYLEAPGLNKIIKRDFLYIDEVAVSPEYQGQGIGRRLMENVFYCYPNETLFLRTLKNSTMFKLVSQMGGKTILNISKKRVIMELTIPESVFDGGRR